MKISPFTPFFLPRALCAAIAAAVFVFLFCAGAAAQTIGKNERDAGREILATVKKDVEKNYYDASYRGIDIDAKFKAADEKIQRAKVLSEIFSTIAQVLIDFGDSHLVFLPPERTASVHYGWLMQMI